ncbi:hypothetical protein SAMN06265360_111103 [Haloechinothrix alba]|uniref:Uncharacterized protein n=1 Tax=Haloechinothrix alba TaxID=664784 RepID=A0A238XM28_9PSEU|nr:hypothetical protein [Haloechinothrix alba]SNR59638.1 hypothetical protein SAMN06265360_111103 [Haloechinothrix alba]
MEANRSFSPTSVPVPGPMSTLSELTCLVLRRPGPHATTSQLAGYFERVATVHSRLAEEARTVAEREAEVGLACRIRDRAERLSTSAMPVVAPQ